MEIGRALLTCLVVLAFPSLARSGCSAAFGQCGGINWTGPTCCTPGSTCMDQYDSDGMKNIYYSECIPAEHMQGNEAPAPKPKEDERPKTSTYDPSVVDCQATMVISPNPPYVDLFGRSILTYRRFKYHKYCVVGDGSAMVKIHIRIMVISNGECKKCKNTECQFWHPDSIGNYEDSCSTSTLSGAFKMRTDIPGDESAQQWGPDPFPHIHYACCCDDSCQANKFYMSGSHDFNSVDGIVVPGPTNIAKQLGPKEYAYDIIIPEGSKRWWPRDDKRDISQLRQSLGVQWDKLYDEDS